MKDNQNTLLNNLVFFFLGALALAITASEKFSNWIYKRSIFNDFISIIEYAKEYGELRTKYDRLLEENRKLYKLSQQNTSTNNSNEKVNINKFNTVITANVITNMTNLNRNYITIDKGEKNGIKENMSVFTDQGFIGIIACVGSHYSTVISLLHDNFYVPAQILKTKINGTIKWDNKNYQKTKLLYIPKNSDIGIGDEVITSNINSFIYPNLLIGTVENITSNEQDSFYTITVKLSNDFKNLNSVYIISNEILNEKVSLEQKTIKKYG